MSPAGDRRSHERFDVVGSLWGLLEVSQSARIRNVSSTGALIDSPIPVALESTQTMKVIVDGEPVTVGGRVRHVRRVEVDAADFSNDGGRYLIGLEFLSPPESVVQAIEQLGDSR